MSVEKALSYIDTIGKIVETIFKEVEKIYPSSLGEGFRLNLLETKALERLAEQVKKDIKTLLKDKPLSLEDMAKVDYELSALLLYLKEITDYLLELEFARLRELEENEYKYFSW